jgi:hypothetical protein
MRHRLVPILVGVVAGLAAFGIGYAANDPDPGLVEQRDEALSRADAERIRADQAEVELDSANETITAAENVMDAADRALTRCRRAIAAG